MKPLLAFGSRNTIMPVMAEDQMAVEWEMDGFLQNWDKPAAELSPQVKAFQDLTIRKWQEYLDSADAGKENDRGARKAYQDCGPEVRLQSDHHHGHHDYRDRDSNQSRRRRQWLVVQ